jgi:non-specific serine/threonine protein kinase/serine/threonine-protein kinase
VPDDSISPNPHSEKTLDHEKTVDLVKAGAHTAEPLGYIGRYLLLAKLGEGGMGQVWLAEQTEPVQRQVALKVIRAGRYDRTALQRFDLERRSLAIMEHPAIAKVFDADSTPEGQPYFVMEYVAGLPITTYCDQKRLSTRARLGLFIQVCEGVQHAHQKAIIHRDLKPSNVLVVEVDGKPQPRIIDFGIAKPTSQIQGETLVTGLGGFVGTPGYMSPEQADPSIADVDTRSDVYSLGVILYELLSGALPFDPKRWMDRPFDEVLRELREDDPPSPSTKISTDDKRSATAAQMRNTDPRELVSVLRGDLDWITLKAVEKDRNRRYATPLDLASDLQHFLNNEPVSARPASRAYRLKKYVQRNRVGVGAALAIVLLLIGFGITELLQVKRITRERDRANRIADFMTGMFKVSDPSEARGNAVTAREILDKGSKDIQTGLAKDPEVQAQMQHTMARTYVNLGLFGRAHDLATTALDTRRRTLGEMDPATLESMNLVGAILDKQGKSTEAEKFSRDALERDQRVLGPGDPRTMDAMDTLAVIEDSEGHYTEEEKMLRDLLAIQRQHLGPDDFQTIRTQANLAGAVSLQGRSAEAEKMYLDALALEKRVLGPDHPQTIATTYNMANNLQQEGRYAEAERLYREELKVEEKVLGRDHPQTANTLTTLANDLYYSQGRMKEAEALYRESLAVEEKTVGDEHPYTMRALEGLANVLSGEGHYAEAEQMHRKILAIRAKTLPPEHTDTLLSQYNLADVLMKEGRLPEAEKLFRQTLEAQGRTLGPENADTLATQTGIAKVLAAEHRYGDAEKLARETFVVQERVLGLQNVDSINTLQFLGQTLVHLGRYPEARTIFEDAIGKLEKTSGADSSGAWYAFASVAAAANDRNRALDYLNAAVQHGYKDLQGMATDDDLKPLRKDPRFQALVSGGDKGPDVKAAQKSEIAPEGAR